MSDRMNKSDNQNYSISSILQSVNFITLMFCLQCNPMEIIIVTVISIIKLIITNRKCEDQPFLIVLFLLVWSVTVDVVNMFGLLHFVILNFSTSPTFLLLIPMLLLSSLVSNGSGDFINFIEFVVFTNQLVNLYNNYNLHEFIGV